MIDRKVLLSLGSFTVVENTIEEGCIVDNHFHTNEQLIYIVKGKVEINVNENKEVLSEGELIYIKPNDKHGLLALSQSHILDIFVPQRKDFL